MSVVATFDHFEVHKRKRKKGIPPGQLLMVKTLNLGIVRGMDTFTKRGHPTHSKAKLTHSVSK